VTGCNLGFRVVLQSVIPPSCKSMASMPYAEASVSRKNSLVKSSCHNTSLSVMALQSVSNAACSSCCQDQGVVRCVS
jgi:hypothetical protein